MAFVIYGSLVPLDFRPATLAHAWQMFQDIRFLNLGEQERADWIANGVLFFPVGFFGVQVLAGSKKQAVSIAAMAATLLFSIALAVAIEFTQEFFPPRTVSLNDILSEFIGSLLGIAVAALSARHFWSWLRSLVHDPRQFAKRLLQAYAIVYVAICLFPYDFLVSLAELEEKIRSNTWGWFIVGGGARTSVAVPLIKLLAEILAALPLGMLAALPGPGRPPWSVGRASLAGAALGAAIEITQFFTVSGISQGISVATRAVGMAAGTWLIIRKNRLDPLRIAAQLRRYALPLGLGYLVALAAVNGWFEHRWQDLDTALLDLEQVHFLPFYYHYYTTEQTALLSLIAVCAMYAPIGILMWAFWLPPSFAFWASSLVAAIIEASKLFLQTLHPDPTNILLAAAAAWAMAKLVDQLAAITASHGHAGQPSQRLQAGEFVDPASATSPRRDSGQRPDPRRADASIASRHRSRSSARIASPRTNNTWSGYLILSTGLGIVAWGLATYPYYAVTLGLTIAGYAALIWRRPQAMVVVLPAALALFDLAPLTGRFYFDEFDLLVVASLAIGYVRLPRARPPRDSIFFALAALVATTYAIATVRGLLPWQWPDQNSFNNYYSPYNALRIGKGMLWAFLLFGLMARLAALGHDVRRLFGVGMVAGLTGVVAVVVWERAAFPGLLNFADVYRVTGPFSQMHVGGARLETYLTLAIPFLLLIIFEARGWMTKLAGVALMLGATYAVMVTFSRVGYVGYAAASLITLLAIVFARRSTGRLSRRPQDSASATAGQPVRLKRIATAVALAGLSTAIAVPVLMGSFAKSRLGQAGTDLTIRQAHWGDALRMRNPDWTTALFGMGLGRYPETHQWRSSEPHAATYRLVTDGEDSFLRLGAGSPLYLEQFVSTEPHQEYTFSVKLRSNQPNARLTVSLCEKWLLTSARCVFRSIDAAPADGWSSAQITLPSRDVGAGPWYDRRPVKFSLYDANANAIVDVDGLRLKTSRGVDLLENGDFEAGLDGWFFSTDSDLPWHVWSLPVQLLFDQGWFGLCSLALFGMLALSRASRASWQGDPAAAAILAAMIGFAAISSLDTLLDGPRMLLLTMLYAWLAARAQRPGGRPQYPQEP